MSAEEWSPSPEAIAKEVATAETILEQRQMWLNADGTVRRPLWVDTITAKMKWEVTPLR